MPWTDIDELVSQNPPSLKEAREVLDYLGRRAKARLYADENFPAVAVSLLGKLGASVHTAQQDGLAGHSDKSQAAHALRNGLVLVTCDRDFLDEKRFPLVHCPAIFVFNFGSGSVREMMQAFRCLAALFRTPQFFDKWWKVDAQRDCWTEFVRFQNGTTSRARFRLWRGTLQEWVEG